ncbi:PAAR domain-containing protein [Dyadobacter sp. 676]|uniref:PAAR domain-containing protein n=1 Tax=Dyadobacter sp. 676 TaxID=3088362 RepID=A0AAU8FUH9_9BACT
MSQPAARVGDMHVCPMATPGTPPVPHVGGPMLPPGTPTVLIGGQPAACVGDMCVCTGPPDSVVAGSTSVLICGKPAARLGDPTAHGGQHCSGLPNSFNRLTTVFT